MPTLHLRDAGLLPYRPAWDLQLQLHEKVSRAEPGFEAGALMLVEHPPVVTIGRRPGAEKHLHASPQLLALRGVDLVETDRGGDITFHGPGQLVAYPILNLNTYNLNLHAYMRLLEEVIIQTLAHYHIKGGRVEGATGVWTPPSETPSQPAPAPTTCSEAKICAIGVKLRRWVTFHGLALNISTDLSFFDLINPCGLGRPVTSMQKLLGPQTPSMPDVKTKLAAVFKEQLASLQMR